MIELNFLGLSKFVFSFKKDFFNLFGVIKDYVINFDFSFWDETKKFNCTLYIIIGLFEKNALP